MQNAHTRKIKKKLYFIKNSTSEATDETRLGREKEKRKNIKKTLVSFFSNFVPLDYYASYARISYFPSVPPQ